MNHQELKPCPFCGSSALDWETAQYVSDEPGTDEITELHTSHWIVCTECIAIGPARETQAESVTLWNTRANSH